MKKWDLVISTPAGRKMGFTCFAETEDEAKRKAIRFGETLLSKPCARGSQVASAAGNPADAPFTFVR